MLLLAGLLLACAGPEETGAPDQRWTPAELERIASLRVTEGWLAPRPDVEEGNAWADSTQAARLGAALFTDTSLSGNGAVSCATCHDPARWFTDGLPRGSGVGTTRRHTPTLVGVARNRWYTWDGRRDTAWAQALVPLEQPAEHGTSRTDLARRVTSTHGEAYRAAFGDLPELTDPDRFPTGARPASDDPVADAAWRGMHPADQAVVNRVFVNAGKALDALERRLAPQPAAFDRYAEALLDGDPTGGGHLGPEAERGLALFLGKADCVLCHHGPTFSDGAFHNLGLPTQPGQEIDLGRGAGVREVLASEFRCGTPWSDASSCPELVYVDPTFPDFMGSFKTPTLRNVADTAPYMHDARFATLEEVLGFYSALPGAPSVGHRELTLRPLKLTTDETRALVAFLQALSAPSPGLPEL